MVRIAAISGGYAALTGSRLGAMVRDESEVDLGESKHDDAAAGKAGGRDWRSHVSGGLIFGLIGMLTGAAGLVLSYQSQHEQQVVKLAAYPSAGADDLTAGGLGVRLQLVNQSLRPLVVRSASLWLGKTRLAQASGYLPDARGLDLADVDPDALNNNLAQFPLNIGAREGRSPALLLDVWNGVSSSDPSAAAAVNRLNLTLSALGPAASLHPPFELHLVLAPGGVRRFPLHTLPPLAASPRARVGTASATAPSWVVSPLGRPPKMIGLLLRHVTAGQGEVDLARLDVWRQDSPKQRSILRPVIGAQATTFPLAGLPPGAYTVTFTVDDKIVANRSFALPWRREPCAVGLQEESGLNGSGSAAWC